MTGVDRIKIRSTPEDVPTQRLFLCESNFQKTRYLQVLVEDLKNLSSLSKCRKKIRNNLRHFQKMCQRDGSHR